MAQKLVAESFRSTFRVVDRNALRWFPGHMGKGLKQMQHKLKLVDCIVEVHDARIPLSGKNSDFKHTISGIKPHILVLNKVDLIDREYLPKIVKALYADYKHVIFTNCKNQHCKGLEKLVPLARELISKADRFNRANLDEYCLMIIGVPNVGKSSLVNALRNRYIRKGKATPVGANPGITKSVLTKIKMSDDPLFFMLDTPGILTPNVPNTEVGLKLALCNTIQNHLVGENVIADYLLYWLNKHKYFDYVRHFNLERRSDNILEVLTQIALNNKKVLKHKDMISGSYIYKPNLDAAAKIMLQNFGNGSLGKIMLDIDLIK